MELGCGEVLRFVRVVALRVVRQDGRKLVQMAHHCKLPGGHMKPGESSDQARERVQMALLPALPGAMHFVSTAREVVNTGSRNYGLLTEYAREIHTLEMLEPCSSLSEA